MTTVRVLPRARLDLERIASHLASNEVSDIEVRIRDVLDALQLLSLHPLIGRRVAGGRRELVIGKGTRGYVALYRYEPLRDEVLVAALRGQREAGFQDH